MTPQRIQLKRTKGWQMPANTVKVDRSTRWGNPFAVTVDRTPAEAVRAFRTWLTVPDCAAGRAAQKQELLNALPQLRGKNLACWCRPGEPCHAEVLLDLANAPSMRPNTRS